MIVQKWLFRRNLGRNYAFVVVAIIFVSLLASAGQRSSAGVLILPLEQAFGWSRSEISFGAAVGLFLYGLVGPFAAALMQSFGLRRTLVCALLLMGTGDRRQLVDDAILAFRSGVGDCLGPRQRLHRHRSRRDHRQSMVCHPPRHGDGSVDREHGDRNADLPAGSRRARRGGRLAGGGADAFGLFLRARSVRSCCCCPNGRAMSDSCPMAPRRTGLRCRRNRGAIH